MTPPPRTRIGVYAWSESNDAVLLCRVAAGEIDAGRWTLPGGGVDFGEHPDAALRRELAEETGLYGTVTGILGVGSLHLEAERRPGVGAMHAIRIVYRVELRGEPRVVEVGGSVDMAAWIPRTDLAQLPTVDLVAFAAELAAGTAKPD